MIERRQFLALLAAAPALGKIPVREAGRVETVFKSPGPYPNGLQATDEGLWIIDGEDARAHLVSYSDGAVLLGFDTEAVHPSGITFDGEAIWVASTYSREIIRADASSGKTIEKYFTPGAGVIYRMPSDPPGRQSPLAPASPPPSATSAPVEPRPATGAHGLEWREGKLWAAVPPSRMIYRIDPESWMGGAALPFRGQPPSRHRLGRRRPVVHRHQPQRLLQTRSRVRRDHREDPACRRRPPAPRNDHPGRRPVVLRRRRHRLPAEAVSRVK